MNAAASLASVTLNPVFRESRLESSFNHGRRQDVFGADGKAQSGDQGQLAHREGFDVRICSCDVLSFRRIDMVERHYGGQSKLRVVEVVGRKAADEKVREPVDMVARIGL